MEVTRIVVVRPVASKPSCSTFKSFTKLLQDSINASPTASTSTTDVVAIRPKTVRLKPVATSAPVGIVPSSSETSGAAVSCSSEVFRSDINSTMPYKPLAKLATKRTFSLSANSGTFNTIHEKMRMQAEVRLQQTEKCHQKSPLQVERGPKDRPSEMGIPNLEKGPRVLPPSQLSSDGYTWRKYGQKQVKGSECPRNYYKCTYPRCLVKKMVERSCDGNIAEVIYKGDHNHPKRKTTEHLLPMAQDQELRFKKSRVEIDIPLRNTLPLDKNKSSESRSDNQSQVEFSVNPASPRKSILLDSSTSGAFSNGVMIPCDSYGYTGHYDKQGRRFEVEPDEPKYKRSKNGCQSDGVGISVKCGSEPSIMVQSSVDSEVLGDGFRWRKYGQKVVKGNPYPRSYYKCANLKCNVRKHVERTSDNQGAFVTTYEGTHNHEMPSSVASNSYSVHLANKSNKR